MTADGEMMTVGEAAEYLGVSGRKLARLIAEGTIVATTDKLDKRIKLVRRVDVEKLANESVRPGQRGKAEQAA